MVTFYEKAEEGKYEESISLLGEAPNWNQEFVDVYLSGRYIYANLKNYQSSVSVFETAILMDSVYFQKLSSALLYFTGWYSNFSKAQAAITEFLNISNLNKQSIQVGSYRKSLWVCTDYTPNIIAAALYTFEPHKNMGDSITSTWNIFPSSLLRYTLIFNKRINSDDGDFTPAIIQA